MISEGRAGQGQGEQEGCSQQFCEYLLSFGCEGRGETFVVEASRVGLQESGDSGGR